MKKIVLTVIIAISTANCLMAANGVQKPQSEKVSVTARGIDYNDALYQALNMAVSKVNGMALSPSGAYVKQWDVKGGYQPAGGGINVQGRLTQTQMNKDVINERFMGYVKTYNVVSSEQGQGYTEVTVEAEVYKYVLPLSDTTDQRVRITVNEFLGENAGTSSISSKLVTDINKGLTSTGKFNVLDRKYISDFASERNIMLSDDAALADKARLAMVCGSDLMISGIVRDFRLKDALRKNYNTDRKLGAYEAKVKVDYSLIVPATLQTRLADTIEFTLSPDEVRKLYKMTSASDLDIDVADVESSIAQMVAERIVNKVTEYAYPVLVASLADQVVYLNEGGSRIKAGDEFDVFKRGEQIFDPQTSLSLGSVETKVARVKVDSVKERMAAASILTGDVNDIAVGSITRRATDDGGIDKAASKPVVPGGKVKKAKGQSSEMQKAAKAAAAIQFVPKKLAIVPVGYNTKGYYYLGSYISGAQTAESFEQYLATSLRRMGKFDLLDRRYDADYRKELQLMLDSSPIDEVFDKLEQVSSADYLLVGKLANFNVVKDSIFIEAAGQQAVKYSASLLYDYRVIEFATRKVVLTGTVNLYYDDDQIKTLVPELNNSDKIAQGESQIQHVLESVAARNVAGQVTDEMYPMLIIAVDGDTVVVSSGSSALREGQELTVFDQGEQMLDPYTGKSVGMIEKEVGRIKVVRTEPSVAYAKIIAGDPEDFTKGCICKTNWQEMGILRQKGKKSNIKTTPSGGVYLPGDRQ